MTKLTFIAAAISLLILLFAPSYIWYAICVQLGFTVGVLIKREVK